MFGNAVSTVHVGLNALIVVLNVVDDAVFNGPFEKVKLPYRGLYERIVYIRKRNSIPPAKRVKPALAVRLQLQLVIHVHLEPPVGAHFVHGEELLGVIRGKPVNDAERNWRLSIDDL